LELSTILSFTAWCSDSLAWQGIDGTVALSDGPEGRKKTHCREWVAWLGRRIGHVWGFLKGRAADSLQSSGHLPPP
jgi:hypothetical protein